AIILLSIYFFLNKKRTNAFLDKNAELEEVETAIKSVLTVVLF
ncbi:MAG: hypothetical protein ACI91R_001018, partial [Vicingaceae bacterium]